MQMQWILMVMIVCALLFLLCLVAALQKMLRKRHDNRERRFKELTRRFESMEDSAFLQALNIPAEDHEAALEARRRISQWAGLPRRRIHPDLELQELAEIGLTGQAPELLVLDLERSFAPDAPCEEPPQLTTVREAVLHTIAQAKRDHESASPMPDPGAGSAGP